MRVTHNPKLTPTTVVLETKTWINFVVTYWICVSLFTRKCFISINAIGVIWSYNKVSNSLFLLFFFFVIRTFTGERKFALLLIIHCVKLKVFKCVVCPVGILCYKSWCSLVSSIGLSVFILYFLATKRALGWNRNMKNWITSVPKTYHFLSSY